MSDSDVTSMPVLRRETSVFQDGNVSVECDKCKSSFERNFRDTWKDTCLECYKKNVRKCVSCDKNLPLKAETWKKKCVSCYRSKMTQCTACDGEFLVSDIQL